MECPHPTWNGQHVSIQSQENNLIRKRQSSTWCKSNSKPPGERHYWVMVDMKKCHLATFLPQHKENLIGRRGEMFECKFKSKHFESQHNDDCDLLCPTFQWTLRNSKSSRLLPSTGEDAIMKTSCSTCEEWLEIHPGWDVRVTYS